MMRSRICLLAMSAIALLGATKPPAQVQLINEFASVLASGDQQRFESFAAKAFDPAVLRDTPAVDQAAAIARMYEDTGGLRIDHLAAERPGAILAEAHDAMTGSLQCLTIAFSRHGGQSWIKDIAVKPIYAAGPSLAPPADAEIVELLSGIAARFDARGLMSGVLLVAKGDRVLLERAYGFASIAHRDPMTLDTRLNVASIGKVITGVAIAQLVAAKRLSYDDAVGRYLSAPVDETIRKKVTIRQLLSHTSGLGPRDYYEFPEWDSARPQLRDIASYLDLIEREKISVGAPQGRFLYSNTGYVLLGAIIEKVTGESFYNYVERHVFLPAGMTSALYAQTDAEIPNIADPLTNLFPIGPNQYRYHLGTPRRAIYELAARGGPQGGATLTAHDLLRLETALQTGRLISADRLAEMERPASPSGAGAKGLSGDVREGLGIEVIRQNGHRFFGHTGGDLGVASSIYRYPDRDMTIIILTNRDPRAARVLTSYSRSLMTRNVIGGAQIPAQSCELPTSN
jgi:CubicO group peptidase (beta-lactamase class C family)